MFCTIIGAACRSLLQPPLLRVNQKRKRTVYVRVCVMLYARRVNNMFHGTREARIEVFDHWRFDCSHVNVTVLIVRAEKRGRSKIVQLYHLAVKCIDK